MAATRASATLLRFARKITQSDRQRAEPVDDQPDPAGPAQWKVTVLDVRAAMALLGPEQRQVIVEMYFRGRSMAEVAEFLDMPVGTVKARSYNGLHQLHRAITGGHGDLPGEDRLSA
jgi:RNA polymerase sigma-70 factor, ECF subfamily